MELVSIKAHKEFNLIIGYIKKIKQQNDLLHRTLYSTAQSTHQSAESTGEQALLVQANVFGWPA